MKAAAIIRTGSGLTQPSLTRVSPRGPAPDAGGISFLRRARSGSYFCPRSIHLEAWDATPKLPRVRSESILIGSDGKTGRWDLAEEIDEEVVKEEKGEESVERRVFLGLGISDRASRIWTGTAAGRIPEEVEFSGGGMGKGRKIGSGGRGGDDGGGDENGMKAYYEEMLKADPGNPLLLRNYGKFMQEVEGDLKKAEEYYGRAILANPEDGEVLSLYGQMIWDNHRDEERAGDYFERSVAASPDDCFVLGSYAHFLWNAEDDEVETDPAAGALVAPSPGLSLVEAY